jgi:mannose-6-phosphate isomerase-like protein (cupin superfamily)
VDPRLDAAIPILVAWRRLPRRPQERSPWPFPARCFAPPTASRSPTATNREHTDAFCVLAGALGFAVGPEGRRTFRAAAGTVVVVPPGVGHAFHNAEAPDAVFLNVLEITVPGAEGQALTFVPQ